MSDVLGSLNASLTALKGGIKRLPIPLESYQAASPPLTSKRLLNLYPEKQPEDALSPVALIPTPGLREAGMGPFGTGPVVAVNGDIPGLFYVVSGTHLYRYGGDPFPGPSLIHDLGDIGVPHVDDYPDQFMVTIAVGVTSCCVCVPPKAYVCGHAPTDMLAEITDPDFTGATSVAYLDGYFVFTAVQPHSQWFISQLLDPTSFDALDFAFADTSPDILFRVITLNGELWFFGQTSVEVWYDAGTSGLETTPGISFFPFRKRAGGVVPYGTLSMKTITICDDAVFWLTNEGLVVRSVGYKVQRVSTTAIETIVYNMGTSTLRPAFSYSQEGHIFYILNFDSRTLGYDCATQAWHERSSSSDGSLPWRPLCAARDGASILLGDSLSGRLFGPEPWLATEDGADVIRQFIMPPIYAGTRRAFCSRLEIEMEVGTYPPVGNIMLEWSDDGGFTWKGPRVMDAGAFLNVHKRVFTTRLGSFRTRTFRITSPRRITVYAIDADITPGAS